MEELKFFLPKEHKEPFWISMAGVTFPDPSYHIIRRNSDISVIEYIVDGNGYVVQDGKIHPVCSGMIYFLTAGNRHEYYADEQQPFTKIFMNISGTFCENLVAAYGLVGQNFFKGDGMKAAFEKIPAILHSDMPEQEMQVLLQGIFVEILSRLSGMQHEKIYSEEARTLKEYLDQNVDKIVSIKELAGTIYRSPDYCLKLFNREFQTTPYAYQLQRKITIAKTLLVDTTMSVGEIAESLGYGDAHYFSNLFKQKCGSSPVHYRKSQKINEEQIDKG